MACYHPLVAVPNLEFPKVIRTYDVKGGLKYTDETRILYPGCIPVPCGHCIGCRLDYSRSWADRMMLELDHSKKAIFATLTYNNDNIPFMLNEETGEAPCFTLRKKDMSDFMKILRSRKEFEDRELRFYGSGEYGEKTARPHMHMIIFGLGLDDFSDLVPHGMNELGQMYYISEHFASIWDKGFCLLTDVSWRTCAYVARYVMKKLNSSKSILSQMYDAEEEFSLMSRRPGIAGYYPIDHPDVFEKGILYVQGHDRGIGVPKYLIEKLAKKFVDGELNPLYNPERYAKLIEDRRIFSQDRLFQKLLQTDLDYVELLEIEEDEKLRKTSVLSRNSVDLE